jgi:benzoyl-CoA reductase/2-hydroxyglutaryl-CoA dehydratase subunit BcrC/BadD/HgdB
MGDWSVSLEGASQPGLFASCLDAHTSLRAAKKPLALRRCAMSSDYRPMWKELGLDLEAHDALLGVLGKLYEETFLKQANRPAGMKYFDFVMSEVHGLRIKELVDARKQGRKVVGAFCTYVPEEIVLALDGVLVGLCAGAEFATPEAEKYLPRNTCALIKGAFGFALARVCPYLAASDVVVGENTCDGKKKGYEIFKELVPNLQVMDLPQTKSAEGRALMKAEFSKFAAYLEKLSGKKLTAELLKKGIAAVNAKRSAMHRLAKLRAADPAPISGLDGLLMNQVFFYDDPTRFTNSVNAICEELEGRVKKGEGVAPKGTVRLLVSGCPMAVPNWKLPSIIEGSGAVIVGEESCVGDRGTQNLTRDDGKTVDDLMDSIVDRYLKIDCAVFTPNTSRIEHIIKMAKDLKAKGVIHYELQFCSPYQVEAKLIEKELAKKGVPLLRIDTDYGQGDIGQIRTRVGAFIERLRG